MNMQYEFPFELKEAQKKEKKKVFILLSFNKRNHSNSYQSIIR